MKIIKPFFLSLVLLFGISLLGWAADLVVTVPPPSGGDDTAVIQAALDQCLGPNPVCTVQLAAGTYLTQELLTVDFHGTFKGMGMGVTIVQGLPNLPVSQVNPVWNNPPSPANPYPILILFWRGDITVSDMTLRDLEMQPFEQGWIEFQDQPQANYLYALLDFMGQSEEMNVVVTRMAFESKAGGANIDVYPHYTMPSPGRFSGTFKVTASRFDGATGIVGGLCHDARLTIGGSPSEGNLIQNVPFAVVLGDLDGTSFVDVSYNNVSVSGAAYAGIWLFQGGFIPIENPSPFLVQHNRIKATGSYEDGILLEDYGSQKSNFVISDNVVTLSPGEDQVPTWAGVEAIFMEGATVSNNRIMGNSTLGISLETASQCMVEGNNVNKLEALWAPIGLLGASLGLPDTTGCTLVGGNNKVNVYDEGINNTLVGVNNIQGNPPGPAIRDAMKRKMEMIKSIRMR